MCIINRSIFIPWTAIFAIETLTIILGNIVTVIVFWKRRSHLKRTCYVLINLSAADFMVGLTNIKNVVSDAWLIKNSTCKLSWPEYDVMDEFFGCASISFLVLISLERMCAIVWPFRMRATSTRTYIYSIGVAWLISGIAVGLNLLMDPSKNFFAWFLTVYICVCLMTILCAYAILWCCSKKEDPRLPLNRQKGNKELAKTLFIVTVLSVIAWLPFGVVYNVRSTLEGVTRSLSFNATRCLQLANSFVNPVVYCFRMPLFRKTLRTMFLRKTTTAGLRLHGCESQKQSDGNNAVVLLSVLMLNVDLVDSNNIKRNPSNEVI